VNNAIRFEQVDNPYAYEGGGESSFDLRIGTFILLIQIVGSQITNEKSTNMFFYLTRAGLLPSAFWIFQYLYWMAVSSVSIGLAALVGLMIDKEIEVGAYFVAAWFHLAFAMVIGSTTKNKKFVNMASISFLILGFVIPIVFASIERSPKNQGIYENFKLIPVFFFFGNVTSRQLTIGSIISACCTLFAAYLGPLLSVSDGMYAKSRVNIFYFLTPQFWREGIVALPSYDETFPELIDENGFDENEVDLNSPFGHGILFHNCVKRFGDDKVIGPMNLKLQAGNITTLLGPNGVGKSTLMRVAAGYYIPSAGEMILDGTNLFRSGLWSCIQSISFCPQDNYIYDYMTVEEHMLLMSKLRDMSRIDDGDILSHIEWILTTLEIIDKRNTLAKNLSGGMKRRLCLGMSVLGFPKVILCDEPSSGVDSVSQRGIWKLLETAKKKSAILLTSHSSLEAVILSDSVVSMKSSEDIIQTKGVQGMAFSLKNVQENTTVEYDVDLSSAHEIASIVSSLPNDGSEWKISSKRLTLGELSPLQSVTKDLQESALDPQENDNQTSQTPNTIPETSFCGTPSTWRQIFVLIGMMVLHVDRMFFLIFFALPINGAQIWLASSFPGWGDMAAMILTSFFPMIAFICSTIIVVQLTEILATERCLGISKLLFSTGITRFAYLCSYLLSYFLLSFPVSFAMLVAVGSVHGTVSGMVAMFWMYLSFFFLLMGTCVALGATVDARTGLIITIILPSVSSIFAQGTVSQTFADMYPGAIGQVIAALTIDNMSKSDWTLYAICLVINILIGCVTFFIFMLKLGNYNPFSNFCQKKDIQDMEKEEVLDIENSGTHDDNIFLEGKSIVKIYGVGEKDTASFRALDDVTFAVTKGSLLGLVGKSGAGKSTLMDILAGQINVSSGAVYVEGERVLPSTISKVVSLCGQVDTVWPDMKVINAIKIFMKCRGYREKSCSREISDPYVRYIINRLDMDEMLPKRVKTLSGGQKRRFAFLVSLLGDTKVVLVDEAMTGVDIETRKIMWTILQDEVRHRDRSVVVTSHEMTEIEQYCNTVGILHDGMLVEMGRLDDIKKKWGDSIKLICLFSDISSVSYTERIIVESQPDIAVVSHHVDVLDEPQKTRIIATYAIDLVQLDNIAGLVHTMNKNSSDHNSLLYWSIQPQSLDDFVRSKSNSDIV